MATLYTHRSENITKTWAFITGFLLFIIGVGFLFAQVYGTAAPLYIAVVFSILMNIGAYWYSDKLVLSMVRAHPVTREENPMLWNIVENLSITAGLPMPKLYVVDDPNPNAFATGRNPEHAAIAVHTGLLSLLNKTELEGVLAHELSHVGNRDTLISTLVVVLAGFVSILSDMFLRAGRHMGGRNNQVKGPVILIGFVLAILAPIIATMIRLAVSRKREFLADASGALLTRYPEGLASALEKISGAETPSTTARHAVAHMYIANPFNEGGIMGGLSKLFATHPPAKERVAALRDMHMG